LFKKNNKQHADKAKSNDPIRKKEKNITQLASYYTIYLMTLTISCCLYSEDK